MTPQPGQPMRWRPHPKLATPDEWRQYAGSVVLVERDLGPFLPADQSDASLYRIRFRDGTPGTAVVTELEPLP